MQISTHCSRYSARITPSHLVSLWRDSLALPPLFLNSRIIIHCHFNANFMMSWGGQGAGCGLPACHHHHLEDKKQTTEESTHPVTPVSILPAICSLLLSAFCPKLIMKLALTWQWIIILDLIYHQLSFYIFMMTLLSSILIQETMIKFENQIQSDTEVIIIIQIKAHHECE